MKLRIALVVVIVCVLLAPARSMSDEIADLKEQIQQMQKAMDTMKERVEQLEEEQKSQKEEIAAIPELEDSVDELSQMPSKIMEEVRKGVNIGGHFKFFMLDRTDGERNDVSQNNNLSAGISDVYLYFSKVLNEWLSLDVAPKIEVLAAATPGLGGDITRAGSASVDVDLDEAYMTVRLPWELEARVGAFYPMFSEEYARQTWWHEQYHGNNGLLFLESWRSLGVELYRNFDFENFSLPVYFYPYLNGDNEESRYVDNNGTKNLLLHVAPEFSLMDVSIRILGSLGWGRWDNDDDNNSWQWLGGADLRYKGISLLGEYLRREQEDSPLIGGGTADAVNEGYYVRAMYTFNPEWRVLAKYSDVDLFFPSTSAVTDNYKTLSMALNYWITSNSTIIPQIELVDADRSDGSETLKYIRWTLGWRTTF
ncbi:MAG: hypothetical protein HY788_11620 [Deltaproteobacteria bacterium]|nr:hypothetical protein [Deltaproteobacteria bacterium]